MTASGGADGTVVNIKEEHSKGTSHAALGAFFEIAKAWRLSADEQMVLLGKPPRSTFFKWKKEGGLLSHDTLERISFILGIYKALHILFPDHAEADEWIRWPNQISICNGQSALSRMLGGSITDLHLIRQYVDAMRGG